MDDLQRFGGDWTQEKLERVRKYLVAYATIMSQYHFSYAYIDAFAGTGYRTLKSNVNQEDLLFPELAEQEPQGFIDGSARIALQIEPIFERFIFIEKDPARFSELEKLKTDFPNHAFKIVLVNADANVYLQDLCKRNWKFHRAVLFLDPFGMTVTWETMKAIAKTKAIDVWILFPLGIAVNRLLKKDGAIDSMWRQRLDDFFGTSDWYDVFYKKQTTLTLFGLETETKKVADFKVISQYFVDRLKTIFADAAPRPLALHNSRNNPLFLLCFACGNEKGAPTAIKIAQDILKK